MLDAAAVQAAFAGFDAASPTPRLCEVAAEVLDVSAVGISAMSVANTAPVCASDGRAYTLQELQFTAGEGPSVDVVTTGEPVAEADLETAGHARWPYFSPQAVELGTAGVFAFPLRKAAAQIGVLTVYQDSPGPLPPSQAAASLLAADLVAERMLVILSKNFTSPGDSPHPFAHRAEVHQASGMIAVQLSCGLDEALARLRAYAFASDLTVDTVARQVVGGTLRLFDDHSPPRTA